MTGCTAIHFERKRKEPLTGLFFLADCLLHGSTSPLSGRSPFCQLRMGKDVAKTLDIKYQVEQQRKIEQTKNQTTMQPPRECKGRVRWPVPRTIDQGLDGICREHVMSTVRRGRQCLFQRMEGAAYLLITYIE